MIILFWLVMGVLFIKCFQWAVAPFVGKKTENSEHHVIYHIEVKNSFNRYGGREYGTEDTQQENIFGERIEGKRW